MTMTALRVLSSEMDEADLIGQQTKIREEIKSKRAELSNLDRLRREATERHEAETAKTFREAYEKADAAVQATELEIASQKAALEALTARQKDGDRTVKATDVRAIKDEIESLQNYLDHDKAERQKAALAYEPYAADNHLAYLAASLLAEGTDASIIVRTRPADAPKVSPAVIVSQKKPTEDYGTIDARGSVDLSLVGEPEIDWERVTAAFTKTGNDGGVSPSGFNFRTASWPIPRLTKPAIGPVNEFRKVFTASVLAHVEDNLRHKAHGYQNTRSGEEAEIGAGSVDLECADGRAVGTIRFEVFGASETRMRFAVEEALRDTRAECIGAVTAAGELRAIDVTAADSRVMGVETDSVSLAGTQIVKRVLVLTVTVEVEFIYEEA